MPRPRAASHEFDVMTDDFAPPAPARRGTRAVVSTILVVLALSIAAWIVAMVMHFARPEVQARTSDFLRHFLTQARIDLGHAPPAASRPKTAAPAPKPPPDRAPGSRRR